MQLPLELAQLRARIDLDHSRGLATEDKVAVDIRDVGLAVSEHHSGQHARIELDVRERVDEFRPQQFQPRGELVRIGRAPGRVWVGEYVTNWEGAAAIK